MSFNENSKAVGRHENVIGWYHSHPGYGCWMSGIDCATQGTNQRYTEPFLAVVVDPIRTCSTGRVEIGAFRTYPEGYKPPDEGPSEYQSIPLGKIEDFGVHQNSCARGASRFGRGPGARARWPITRLDLRSSPRGLPPAAAAPPAQVLPAGRLLL